MEGGCIRCAQVFPALAATADDGVCARCRQNPPSYDRLIVYGAYEDELGEAVRLLKFRGVRALGRELGSRLASVYQRSGVEADWIVPTPLHWDRRRTRGFNQAGLLAAPVAKASGLPIVHALSRVRVTAPQAGLSRDQRRQNLRGAFRVRRPEWLRGKRIVVVDDVATTGATFEACARALKRAGAAEVTALAVARADAEIRG